MSLTPGIVWLGQRLTCRGKRRHQTIEPWRSDRCGRQFSEWSHRLRRRQSIPQRADALHGLDEPGAEQGHEHEVHAVQAPIEHAVTAADNRLISTKQVAQKPAIKARIPSRSHTRTEGLVIGVVRIFRVAGHIAD